MKTSRFLIQTVLAGVCSIFLAAGCTSYRMKCLPPDDSMRHWSESETASAHSVFVIEFDDMGEFWDIRQLWAAADYLKKVHEENPQGVLTVMFVHGWHQHADWEKGRLTWFNEQIQRMAKESVDLASETGEEKAQPVVGIYLAWRGQLNTIPLVKQATFWNRIMAARRVASVDFTEAVVSLVEAIDGYGDQSECILMGHSMGATILEYAMTPYLSSQLFDSGQEADVSSSVDLVMLVNPSVEARYTMQLIDILKRRHVRLHKVDENGVMHPAKGPLMVNFSAEDDVVTRVTFPVGQFFTTLFLRFRDYPDPDSPSQYNMTMKTAANMPYLVSHRVDMNEDGSFILTPSTNSYNDTPFWVVEVSSDIMKDHSDIDNINFQHLISYFLDLNDVYNPDTSLKVTQDLEQGREIYARQFQVPDKTINEPVPR